MPAHPPSPWPARRTAAGRPTAWPESPARAGRDDRAGASAVWPPRLRARRPAGPSSPGAGVHLPRGCGRAARRLAVSPASSRRPARGGGVRPRAPPAPRASAAAAARSRRAGRRAQRAGRRARPSDRAPPAARRRRWRCSKGFPSEWGQRWVLQQRPRPAARRPSGSAEVAGPVMLSPGRALPEADAGMRAPAATATPRPGRPAD